MKKPKNFISEGAAVELLQRIFGNTDTDVMTLQEVYVAAGRGELDEETNRNWVNNVMTKLRYHSLITPDYTYGNRKKLSGIKLTIAGRTAIGRAASDEAAGVDNGSRPPRPATSLTLDEMLATVEQLRKKYPAFDIELIIKPKESPMQQ